MYKWGALLLLLLFLIFGGTYIWEKFNDTPDQHVEDSISYQTDKSFENQDLKTYNINFGDENIEKKVSNDIDIQNNKTDEVNIILKYATIVLLYLIVLLLSLYIYNLYYSLVFSVIKRDKR